MESMVMNFDDFKKQCKTSEAQRKACQKYHEKNKDKRQEQNTIYVRKKYENDEEYREKKRQSSLERYYRKKLEKQNSSDPENSDN